MLPPCGVLVQTLERHTCRLGGPQVVQLAVDLGKQRDEAELVRGRMQWLDLAASVSIRRMKGSNRLLT
jgi:hypothetical protein